LAIKLRPKARAMKIKLDVLGKGVSLPFTGTGAGVLATWVLANAKNKKRNVPTNSPRAATMLLRFVSDLVNMGSLVGEPFWPASEAKESMRHGLLAEGLIVASVCVETVGDIEVSFER
jgi:hypothetical protein